MTFSDAVSTFFLKRRIQKIEQIKSIDFERQQKKKKRLRDGQRQRTKKITNAKRNMKHGKLTHIAIIKRFGYHFFRFSFVCVRITRFRNRFPCPYSEYISHLSIPRILSLSPFRSRLFFVCVSVLSILCHHRRRRCHRFPNS